MVTLDRSESAPPQRSKQHIDDALTAFSHLACACVVNALNVASTTIGGHHGATAKPTPHRVHRQQALLGGGVA